MSLDDVVKCLGVPYYQSKDFVLYNMDCVEGMKKLFGSDIKIDLTITSPPYNIGKEYEDNLEIDDYVKWCRNWMSLIFDVTKDNGSFWLNLGYTHVEKKGRAVPIPYLIWDKSKFFLNQEVVWHYGAGVSCKNYLSPRNEKFLWYVKDKNNYTFNLDDIRDKNVKYPNQKKGGKLRCNPKGKNPSDVWIIPKVTSGNKRSSKERTPHPAQFPLAVIERIVKGCSNSCDLVLDPFMGSGTVAECCISNCRKVIGFEIKEEYCLIAKNRIIDFTSQPKITNIFSKKRKRTDDDDDDYDRKSKRRKK